MEGWVAREKCDALNGEFLSGNDAGTYGTCHFPITSGQPRRSSPPQDSPSSEQQYTPPPVYTPPAPVYTPPRATPPPPPAPTLRIERNSSASIEWTVCNKSDIKIHVAAYYVDVNNSRWKSQGWWTVESGQCDALFDSNNSIAYVYAESDGRKWIWTGDTRECVSNPGPFEIYDDQMSSSRCPDNVRKFSKWEAQSSTKATYNFNP
ncbi:DUF1036 domain-containing protein [Sphingomonas oligophenolica]